MLPEIFLKFFYNEAEILKNKVNLAIIDTDLTIRTLQKYPLSDNGRQILVMKGGENHFMPQITNTSYLEFPTRKKYYLFGEKIYKRIYFAMNKAKKCVDFESGEVSLPSPEEMKKAISALVIGKMGQDANKMMWFHWATLIFAFLSFLILLNLSGVIN